MSGLLQALGHTPPWVFAVFVLLLGLGYQQSRARIVGRRRLLALPLIMAGLSLLGVVSSFGLSLPSLAAWLLGFLILALMARSRLTPRGASHLPDSDAFRVPGSWVPLAAMLAIFALKYLTGYLQARGLPLAQARWYAPLQGLFLGLPGGFFAGRAAGILGTRRPQAAG